ncbi:MAG: hypothetical protein JSR70_06135 [Proteobacteria bacterium]|nr:hypothetical protein [Pseudomonadota bacterium]
MKKTVLVALLMLSSSMTHASSITPTSEIVSFDFWEWVSSFFDGTNDQAPQSLVKSDGIIYD